MKGIITLCGSTRFKEEFLYVNAELTLANWIVLSVGSFLHSNQTSDEEYKRIMKHKLYLDLLHKQKIDMSQAIVIINKDGYVGDSTKSEIYHAATRGKTLYVYEPEQIKKLVDDMETYGMKELGYKPFLGWKRLCQ